MRALAAALRSAVAQIGGIDSSVYGNVSSLTFTGPAATRLGAELNTWHRSLSGAVSSLEDTAALLERSAAQVEAEQQARARLEARLADEGCHER
jgi:hypothetical protein